jgi:spore maturation protein CgeB
LRVGVVGSPDPDSFADNIMSVLTTMGHDPVGLGPALPRGRTIPAAMAFGLLARVVTVAETYQASLVRTARREHPEVIVNVDAALMPATVAALRRLGCKVVFWFPDHVANLDRQVMLVAGYDAIFFKDRLLVERLRDLTSAPVHYLPEACNPAWHRPSLRREVHPVVLLAGNLYPSRVLLLERLHGAGVPLELHSTGFPRWTKGLGVQDLAVQPDIRRHDKARAFRRAAAVLNNLHPAEMDSVNCRLFEAAGCGAVVLCEDRPVLGELFDRGSEVLAYANFDELMDHIRHALADPDRGTQIGDAAALRAHSEHTYQHRLREIFAVLGVPSIGGPRTRAKE